MEYATTPVPRATAWLRARSSRIVAASAPDSATIAALHHAARDRFGVRRPHLIDGDAVVARKPRMRAEHDASRQGATIPIPSHALIRRLARPDFATVGAEAAAIHANAANPQPEHIIHRS